MAPSATPTPAAPPATKTSPNPTEQAALVGTLRAIGMVLGARLLLLISILFGFAIALRATDALGVGLFVAWCVCTIGPLTYLDWLQRPRSGG